MNQKFKVSMCAGVDGVSKLRKRSKVQASWLPFAQKHKNLPEELSNSHTRVTQKLNAVVNLFPQR